MLESKDDSFQILRPLKTIKHVGTSSVHLIEIRVLKRESITMLLSNLFASRRYIWRRYDVLSFLIALDANVALSAAHMGDAALTVDQLGDVDETTGELVVDHEAPMVGSRRIRRVKFEQQVLRQREYLHLQELYSAMNASVPYTSRAPVFTSIHVSGY